MVEKVVSPFTGGEAIVESEIIFSAPYDAGRKKALKGLTQATVLAGGHDFEILQDFRKLVIVLVDRSIHVKCLQYGILTARRPVLTPISRTILF